MSIEELENNKIPIGHVNLVGVGRLGIRIGIAETLANIRWISFPVSAPTRNI